MTSSDSRVVKECLITVTDKKTDQTARKVVIHLKAISTGGEMEEPATCKNYLQVQRAGHSDKCQKGQQGGSRPTGP